MVLTISELKSRINEFPDNQRVVISDCQISSTISSQFTPTQPNKAPELVKVPTAPVLNIKQDDTFSELVTQRVDSMRRPVVFGKAFMDGCSTDAEDAMIDRLDLEIYNRAKMLSAQ